MITASPDTAVANATDVAVTLTFDTNGIFDLSRMVVGASIPGTTSIDPQSGEVKPTVVIGPAAVYLLARL